MLRIAIGIKLRKKLWPESKYAEIKSIKDVTDDKGSGQVLFEYEDGKRLWCNINNIGDEYEETEDSKSQSFLYPIEEKDDVINHPSHYTQGIETIDFIESHKMNFCQGNIIKYITRYKLKGTPLDDLKKAKFYIERLIADEEGD